MNQPTGPTGPTGPIYLDYNATTPVDPAVRDAMLPCLGELFGNPSSGYLYGRAAKEAVIRARQQVAAFIGASPEEITFTSGGSEADNQAIIDLFDMKGMYGDKEGEWGGKNAAKLKAKN